MEKLCRRYSRHNSQTMCPYIYQPIFLLGTADMQYQAIVMGISVDTYPRVRRIVRTEETVLPVDYAYQIDGRIIIAWLCLAETKSIDGTYLFQSTEI